MPQAVLQSEIRYRYYSHKWKQANMHDIASKSLPIRLPRGGTYPITQDCQPLLPECVCHIVASIASNQAHGDPSGHPGNLLSILIRHQEQGLDSCPPPPSLPRAWFRWGPASLPLRGWGFGLRREFDFSLLCPRGSVCPSFRGRAGRRQNSRAIGRVVPVVLAFPPSP